MVKSVICLLGNVGAFSDLLVLRSYDFEGLPPSIIRSSFSWPSYPDCP